MHILRSYRGYNSLIETSFVDNSVKSSDLSMDEWFSWRIEISRQKLPEMENAGCELAKLMRN